MTDYLLNGDPAIIARATTTTKTNEDGEISSAPKAGMNIIGPRILDGIAYVNVRTEQSFTIPAGVSVTGPELSAAVIGIWSDPIPVPTETNSK